MNARKSIHLGAARHAAALVLAVLISAALAAASLAQEEEGPLERARQGLRAAMRRISIPKSRLSDGPHVRAAFRQVIAQATDATVRVKADGENVAVGGVVGRNGWILTKASQLSGDVSVQLKDGQELPARVAGVNDEYDLVMLKVEASDLPVLELARTEPARLGQWVATPGVGRDPLSIGVVSAYPREIPSPRGYLGIQMKDEEGEPGPRVELVVRESGAEKAGVLINDVITSVNGEPTPNSRALIRVVRQFAPDDEIELNIVRDGETMVLKAKLSEQLMGMGPDRGAVQNRMGSLLSRRRGGFPSVFTHDSVLKPVDCGGPLVDLDGRTIGFNIARGGRTESYAVPTPVIMTLLYDLMSGNLAPQVTVASTAAAATSDTVITRVENQGNRPTPRRGNPRGLPPIPVPSEN